MWHRSEGHTSGHPSVAALPAWLSKGWQKNREEVAPFGRNCMRQCHVQAGLEGYLSMQGRGGSPTRAMRERRPWEGKKVLSSFYQ